VAIKGIMQTWKGVATKGNAIATLADMS
jgi:hypothetical protein